MLRIGAILFLHVKHFVSNTPFPDLFAQRYLVKSHYISSSLIQRSDKQFQTEEKRKTRENHHHYGKKLRARGFFSQGTINLTQLDIRKVKIHERGEDFSQSGE